MGRPSRNVEATVRPRLNKGGEDRKATAQYRVPGIARPLCIVSEGRTRVMMVLAYNRKSFTEGKSILKNLEKNDMDYSHGLLLQDGKN